MRIAILGPGPEPSDGLPVDVVDDLARLARPDIEVCYRFVGGGPTAIMSDDDVRATAPLVVIAAERAASEGFAGALMSIHAAHSPFVAVRGRVGRCR